VKRLPPRDDNTRNLQEYRKEKPQELTLFELLGLNNKKYSHTIELYDFAPKHFWGKVEREKAEKSKREVLPDLEKEFECRTLRYQLRLKPASITGKDGWTRDFYPGQREELVEDALRKLAAEGQGVFLDDAVGVTFTLYELQKELERMGHGYNKNQIKEALEICKRTTMIITSEDGSTVLESNIFETLGLQTQDNWKSEGEKTRCYVRFNSLVTAAIKKGTYRRINYEKAMTYGVIARQLYKRLSHHYTQASLFNQYSIMLTTLIRDFGLTRYKQLRDNLRDVIAALEEMKEKGDLVSYEVSRVLDAKQRNKLIDAKIALTTSPGFNKEAMEENRLHPPGKLPSQTEA
jgi:hypothetical protein